MLITSGPPSQPVMYSVPGPGEVTTGDSVTVHCDLASAGNPPAHITWYQGNSRVADTRVTKEMTEDGGIASSINVVIRDSDITYFTCEASNKAADEKLRSKLSIKPTKLSTTSTTSTTTAFTTNLPSTSPTPVMEERGDKRQGLQDEGETVEDCLDSL